MSLANISLVGNIVRAPEQMYFASGRVKTTILVAINNPPRNGRNAESADFYKVETWGKLAELAGKYLAKGNQVGVTGRLIMDHWTDKTGASRVTPVVEATQLALPPRLKVVSESPAGDCAISIGGELELSDKSQEVAAPAEIDYPFAEEEKPSVAEPIASGRSIRSA